eukprot:1861177-Rhodomonas_salina.2
MAALPPETAALDQELQHWTKSLSKERDGSKRWGLSKGQDWVDGTGLAHEGESGPLRSSRSAPCASSSSLPSAGPTAPATDSSVKGG